MNIPNTMNIFVRILAAGTLVIATTLAHATKYSGEWNVSRGAGGTLTLNVSGGQITGDLKDTGWEEMTGERRTGRLTGTVAGGRFKITIRYSTGASSSFQGNIDHDDHDLFMTGLQYVGNKPVTNTRFTSTAHRQANHDADVAGVWEGSFTYGTHKGHVRAFMSPDYSFSGDMESNDGTRWTFKGTADRKSERMRITVDSGASKQTYVGTYTVRSDGSLRIWYDKDTGPFEATVRRNH